MSASLAVVVPAALDVRGLAESIPLQMWQAFLIASVLFSVGVLYRVVQPGGRWGQRLRSRFVLGVPWGTVLGLSVVLGVYFFVQGGLAHRFDPVNLPFRATSYAYPLGVVLAGFSHFGWGHLLGNLLSGLVFGSIAEYGWSHYPTDRGGHSFGSWLTNPFVRIGLFFVGIIVAGLATAALSWGPLIGFSGVVYLLAGVALVFYPITTIVGIVAWPRLWHLFSAFNDPLQIAEPSVGYSGVGFAGTAVQGHAFGFLIGVLIGAAILHRRRRAASPGRIWFAAMIYTVANELWSIFWYLGNSQYIRFRTLGTMLLFALAGLIVLVVAGSDRSLSDRVPGSDDRSMPIPSGRQVAAGVILFSLVLMSVVGVAINLSAPSGADFSDDSIEVRDYEIAYVQNVTNQQIAVVDLPLLDQVTNVRTSGVVVYSEQRRLWHQVISESNLESRGSGRVLVGGVGWREPVYAYRSGWEVVGGDVTYQVFLRPESREPKLVHTADPAIADVILANRTVAIRSGTDTFEVVVRRDNQTLDIGRFPSNGNNVTVGGITFERANQNLYASVDGTALRIAQRRIPPTRRR
ncbi:rhomboid family intramembrane serine protease [Halorhabdus salina]|uniref:rhomboid family intramembrane serine protease n=1 Tax=Halorhabdus salina TaxID=2750670 RepID=UPI0015EF07E1|nr:rhomboid family intramembrane serine protease [Halorhabdus salina]